MQVQETLFKKEFYDIIEKTDRKDFTMDKRKAVLILAFITLGILLLSVPATYIWSPQAGAILRWVGVALGIVYFILRSKIRKEQ